SILIAFLIFGALLSIQNALLRGPGSNNTDLLVTVNKINLTVGMPYAYVERVRALEGVKLAANINWFGGYFREARDQIVAFAVDPETFLAIHTEYVLDPAQRAAFLQDRGALAVGAAVAAREGWKVGDRIPLSSNIYTRKDGQAWDFPIAAIVNGDDT